MYKFVLTTAFVIFYQFGNCQNNEFIGISWEEEKQGELKVVFENGKLLIDQNLSDIRTNAK